MEVTLGGDRLGSGKQMQQELHNYYRSTHDLSRKFRTSAGAGILIPCYCKPLTKGEKFEIDLEAAVRTIPTKGPLFGSFKLQVDFFQCPFRLYQAILHNNPTRIGMKMANVKLPMLQVTTRNEEDEDVLKAGKFSNSCLLKYLGMSGLGKTQHPEVATNWGRNILAIPALAYYDIFKTYYSNKQEENAYVITNVQRIAPAELIELYYEDGSNELTEPSDNNIIEVGCLSPTGTIIIDISGENINARNTFIEFTKGDMQLGGKISIYDWTQRVMLGTYTENATYIEWEFTAASFTNQFGYAFDTISITTSDETFEYEELNLMPFKLSNIDDMRMDILSFNNLGTPFVIKKDTAYYPYKALVATNFDGKTTNNYPLNGLCVKTYQSDIFNNWLNSEWIEGENGIAELTKVAVVNGAFKIDALNYAEKLYDLYNRVAVSGGTYQDWENAVYEDSPTKHIESPVYLGGMSSEVVFEEIIQTAPAGSGDDATELGTLGGRGTLANFKGGKVDVHAGEASFIIGIASITPRITYTQGNQWYMTELETMDDLHKPALDGIGFQNLIGERMAWWDTTIRPSDLAGAILYRHSIGKIPAWTEYMTDVDEAFGDFAEDADKGGFMVLGRNYEATKDGNIKDATTYIDPSKFNYAFAYTKLDAQNFWLQINIRNIARRLMSAKQIPNV